MKNPTCPIQRISHNHRICIAIITGMLAVALLWRWNEAMGSTIIGGLISLLVALFVEWARKPKLKIIVYNEDTTYDPPDEQLHKTGKTFRHLWVKNVPVCAPLGLFVSREPALACKGTIIFRKLNPGGLCGHSVGGPMPIRWSKSPQPFLPDSQTESGWIHNPFATIEPMSIFCDGEPERFDVAAIEDGDRYWYGWCNDAYVKPGFKRDDRKMEKGAEYLVQVKIWSGSVRALGSFRFNTNTGQITALPCCCSTCQTESLQ